MLPLNFENLNFQLTSFLVPELMSPSLSSGKEATRKGEGVLITELEGMLVLAPRVFLRVLWFSSLHKNQHF